MPANYVSKVLLFSTWQELPDNQEGLTPSPSPAEAEMDVQPDGAEKPTEPLLHGAEAEPEESKKAVGDADMLAEPAQSAGQDGENQLGAATAVVPESEVPEPRNAAVAEPDQKAVEPGVETPIQPEVAVEGDKAADKASVPSAEGPPDRTLELAGLQALMKNHEARLQIQSQNELAKAKSVKAQQGFVVHTPKVEDRKSLLQQWVASNANAQSIEADLVITRSSANQTRSTRELLTTQEMQKRDIPIEKIRAIVARGNGVPDPDCPGVASLTRFWVSTSTKEVDLDETKQESNVRLQADASSTLAATFGAARSSGSSATGADGMQQILQSLAAPSTDDGGLLFSGIFLFVIFLPKQGFRTACGVPKAKAKARGKAKAKAKAASVHSGSGVSEVAPKTMDEMKAEMSHGLNFLDCNTLSIH
eukprot:s3284_g10.t1